MKKFIAIFSMLMLSSVARADFVEPGDVVGYPYDPPCSVVDGVYTCSDNKDPSSACGVVGGVYTCTDGQDALSKFCTYVNGQLLCTGGSAAQSLGHAIIDATNAGTAMASALKVQSGWISDVMEWFKGAFLFIPKWVWQKILESLGMMIGLIPAPAALTYLVGNDQTPGLLSQLPGSLIWILDKCQVAFGIQVVFGAMVSRWIWRKLPLVGG